MTEEAVKVISEPRVLSRILDSMEGLTPTQAQRILTYVLSWNTDRGLSHSKPMVYLDNTESLTASDSGH